MDIKLDIAFREAMEEINDLNKRLVLERSMKRQMEEELKRIIDENKGLKEEIEKLKKEK